MRLVLTKPRGCFLPDWQADVLLSLQYRLCPAKIANNIQWRDAKVARGCDNFVVCQGFGLELDGIEKYVDSVEEAYG